MADLRGHARYRTGGAGEAGNDYMQRLSVVRDRDEVGVYEQLLREIIGGVHYLHLQAGVFLARQIVEHIQARMHLQSHEAGDSGAVAGAQVAQQPCRSHAHRVVGLLIVFADEVDPARGCDARAAKVVFVVALAAVPYQALAELLVVQRGLYLVAQGFHVG